MALLLVVSEQTQIGANTMTSCLDELIKRQDTDEKRRKFYIEQRDKLNRDREMLPSWCKTLGIKYTSELEDDLYNIKAAAKQKPICDKCTYTLETCKTCEAACSASNNKYLGCEKYKTWFDEECKRASAMACARRSGIGKRYIGKTFDTFNVTDETRKVFDACKAYADNYKEGETSKGLKLFGNYGCGKTHLVSAIIHQIGRTGCESSFINVPELFIEIKQNFGNGEKDAYYLVNKAKKAPLLILDDLGAEKPSEWVQEQLYVIVNHRYEDMLPTIVTTNCPTGDLVNRLGERTVSRLIEMTDSYKIVANDYRLRKG